MSEVISSPYSKVIIGVFAVLLIAAGAYMIIKNLVGLLEGFGGLILVIIGIALLSIVS